MDSFAGIEAFAAVVERGGFTAAATTLQTAKSSISETVRALEERLGVRLLERTTRRVRPTEAGVAYYAQCRRLLDAAATARSEVQATHKAPAGKLRVGVPDAFAERYIVPGLGVFLAAYPTISIELVEAAGAADLVDQQLDLAIRIVEKPESRLVVRRIATSRVVIVASPSYLAGAGTPQRPRDILIHRLVGFSPLAWRDTWRLGRETVAVQPRLLSNSGESLRAAALAGLGLTPAPEWLVADLLVAGQLTRVLAGYETPSGGIYAVYPTNRLLAPRVRVFVDHIVRDLRARGLPR
ncbi:MAG: LysR substrate-binding domain-containing protein [Reyranellaceae bacterium]